MPSVLSRIGMPMVVISAFAILAGCTPVADDNPATAVPTPPAAIEQTPQPNPIPSLSPTGTPIDLHCSDLVSAQTLYDFNPNFGDIDGYKPAAGTVGASAVEFHGLACRWQNQTSNETVDLSVADVDADTIASLKKAADSGSTPATVAAADAAYFTAQGGVGAAIVFRGGYWIVISSPYFSELSDASPFIDSTLAALPE